MHYKSQYPIIIMPLSQKLCPIVWALDDSGIRAIDSYLFITIFHQSHFADFWCQSRKQQHEMITCKNWQEYTAAIQEGIGPTANLCFQ
jgi:hypothetical protein